MSLVIVTGVHGFVGKHLVDALLNEGFTVVGVGREKRISRELENKVESYYPCDLADPESVQHLPLRDAQAVINLAGLAAVGPSFDKPDLYMQTNTAILNNLCLSSVQQKAGSLRILSISSGAVYSSNQSMPLHEDSKLDPESSPYAASKIAMEELSQMYREKGLDCVIARPFNHIGPGQLPGFLIPDLFQKIVEAQNNNSKVIKVGNLTSRRDYTDVRDVVKAYVKLIAAPKLSHSVYNICSGHSISGKEVLDMLLDQMHGNDMTVEIDQSLFRPSDSQVLFGDNSRIREDTGWVPAINIRETIADFVSSKF